MYPTQSLPGLLASGFLLLVGRSQPLFCVSHFYWSLRLGAEPNPPSLPWDLMKLNGSHLTKSPSWLDVLLCHLGLALKLLSMTWKALHDLYPSYCSSLGFLTDPQPAIIPWAPASRSYSQLPKPTSPFSPLAICTLNSVFQKCHFCPSPFQLPRFSSSSASCRKLP